MTTTTLTLTADAYKQAYDALKLAEEALDKARTALEADYDLAGVTRHPTSDGHMVAIETVERREFDLNALRIHAPAAFDKVTALKVEPKKFDAQVKQGNISPEAVAATVTVKPHTRVIVGVAVATE
jgi:hypothetical protein